MIGAVSFALVRLAVIVAFVVAALSAHRQFGGSGGLSFLIPWLGGYILAQILDLLEIVRGR